MGRRMGRWVVAVARYLWCVLLNLREATQRWFDDDAGLLAAGVAFYATISLVPFLLVLIAAFSLFLNHTSWGLDVELDFIVAIEDTLSSEVADSVSTALQQCQDHTTLGGPVGLLGLVAAAMVVCMRFERALELIWKTERRRNQSLWSRGLHLLMYRMKALATLLALGLVVAVVFGASMTLTTVHRFTESHLPIAPWGWLLAEAVVSMGLNACVFTSIYRLLGRAKVDLRRAARGGLLAAVTWEAGRLVLAEFLIADRYTAYGVVGSLSAVMLWAYYAVGVLLLGAEYVQVIREHDAGSLRTAGRTSSDDAPVTLWMARESLRIEQMDRGFQRWRLHQGETRRERSAAA